MVLKETETEIIDKLFLELRQFSKARTPDEIKYDQLLTAVIRKFSNETRHETALRYILNAEISKDIQCASNNGYDATSGGHNI